MEFLFIFFLVFLPFSVVGYVFRVVGTAPTSTPTSSSLFLACPFSIDVKIDIFDIPASLREIFVDPFDEEISRWFLSFAFFHLLLPSLQSSRQNRGHDASSRIGISL